jgi:dGTPase
MHADGATALAAFRAFNFDRIYLRPASVEQADRAIELLRALVEWLLAHPRDIDAEDDVVEHDPLSAAVRYVSGMTDRFALRIAVNRLGWDPAKLPRGVL